MKADLAALCVAHGLPPPVAEYKFLADRKFRFDWCWPHHPIATALNWRLAIEIEGGAFVGGRHSRGVGFTNDMKKYELALNNNWIVYRIAPDWLGTIGTLDTIRRLLVTP